MVTFILDHQNDKDVHDIKESFYALDRQKTGRLKIELAYTLLLGLGYINFTRKDEFNEFTLEEAAKRIESIESESRNEADFDSGIRLDTLLTVIATVRAVVERNQN
mmetsp:Transcript_5867/g.14609  ORF Transcript_5867/g.14609 Transcript_5867/m.14609 type:complete len:106 (-) Transcript_5867:451-768(-)